MFYKFKIWNYRNISSEYPLEFELRDGITFILGPNNIGKSNLINFFSDFRAIFLQHGSGQQSSYSFTITLKNTFFDQVINRNSSQNEIYLEIKDALNQIICYTIFPSGSQGTHTTDVGIKLEFKNVGINTSELRDLLTNLENLFKDIFIVGVYRTPQPIASGNSIDLKIGSEFINAWSEWADTGNVEKMKKIKQLKDELKTLFSSNNFNIRTAKDKSDLIITNDDGEFLLKELGSGIGQFILVLGNALMRNPSYIMIDEPEASLHPKMQEIFTRALASKSRKGLLAASHSIALARSVSDSIYTLVKNEQNAPVISPYGQHYHPTISQSINEMSYSQYVEIGGNNILLVEGRTDVKSFREILRKYGIENKYIILSFGGSQFITNKKEKIVEELSEIKRLNANSVNVIFDSMRKSSSDSLKNEFKIFKETCEELEYKVFPTDRHSTENYISQHAINKVMGSGYSALGEFENFKDSANKWPKEKNWLMFIEMNKKDFAGTELDLFIKNTLAKV